METAVRETRPWPPQRVASVLVGLGVATAGALRFVVVAGGTDALFHDVDDERRPAVDYLYTAIKRATTPDALDTRALAYVDDLQRHLAETCGVAP